VSDDKVTPMFSDHDVIRAAKAEQERMNAHQAEEQRKIASTIPESAMPCPRLELRWHKEEYELRCDYNFVLPIHKYDIREDAPVRFGSELRFCMGWITSHGGNPEYPLWPNGVIEVPFRDGKHAAWDSHATGFPAFVVYQGQAQSILPEEHSGGPIEEKEEYDREHRDWAGQHYYHLVADLKNQLRRFSHRVRDLRDKHREGSWAWLYFDEMLEDVNEKTSELGESFGYDFEDWMAERAPRIHIEKVKRVCSECGADIPKDLTKACEHVFGEDARAFLKKKEKGDG